MANQVSLKMYNIWKNSRMLINLGVKALDFIGNKYDERKITNDQRMLAITQLNYLKSLSDNSSASLNKINKYFNEKEFRWTADPFKGKFDYKSKPLITMIKKSGDCDDFATLYSYLFPSLKRYAIFGDDYKNGHVITMGVLNDNTHYVVTSNLNILGSYSTKTPLQAIVIAGREWFKGQDVQCVFEFSDSGKIDKISVWPFN